MIGRVADEDERMRKYKIQGRWPWNNLENVVKLAQKRRASITYSQQASSLRRTKSFFTLAHFSQNINERIPYLSEHSNRVHFVKTKIKRKRKIETRGRLQKRTKSRTPKIWVPVIGCAKNTDQPVSIEWISHPAQTHKLRDPNTILYIFGRRSIEWTKSTKIVVSVKLRPESQQKRTVVFKQFRERAIDRSRRRGRKQRSPQIETNIIYTWKFAHSQGENGKEKSLRIWPCTKMINT